MKGRRRKREEERGRKEEGGRRRKEEGRGRRKMEGEGRRRKEEGRGRSEEGGGRRKWKSVLHTTVCAFIGALCFSRSFATSILFSLAVRCRGVSPF